MVPLGLPDRWDYVVYDRASHRVYVSHGDRVTVVDGRSGAVIGQVEGFPGGTHGIAIATASGRGYTDDGRAGEAGSFDLATLKVQQRIKAAADADAVAFDPRSGHVFVVNGDPGTLTVIDPKTDSAIATVQAGGKREYAVADRQRQAGRQRGGKEGNRPHLDEYQPGRCALADPELRQPARSAGGSWPSQPRCFPAVPTRCWWWSTPTAVRPSPPCPSARAPMPLLSDLKRRSGSVHGPRRHPQRHSRAGPEHFRGRRRSNLATAVTARTMAVDPDSGRIFLVAADIDPNVAAPAAGAPAGPPRRPALLAGSTKLLFLHLLAATGRLRP